MAYMVYINLNVSCQRKAVKLDHLLTSQFILWRKDKMTYFAEKVFNKKSISMQISLIFIPKHLTH